jgi:L-malate glycosyltransferase
MRIALLGSLDSVHFQRWIQGLAGAGVELFVFSLHSPRAFEVPPGVTVRTAPFAMGTGYLLAAAHLRRALKEWKPDLLHTHYASGYGTLARLSGFRPSLLSVWGSDITEFPHRSRFHGWWLKRNLGAASHLAATSRFLEKAIRDFDESAPVQITPFGVSTDRFRPAAASAAATFRVGTVRGLEPVYGIDTLLRAFARFSESVRQDTTLTIVGDGTRRAEYEALAQSLGIGGKTRFLGRIPNEELTSHLNELDLFVAPSRSEGFGVAVLEAAACGIPSIVSRVGALPEIVDDGVTGVLIPPEDELALVSALERLCRAPEIRRRMGRAARERVEKTYSWQVSVDTMIALYQKVSLGPVA